MTILPLSLHGILRCEMEGNLAVPENQQVTPRFAALWLRGVGPGGQKNGLDTTLSALAVGINCVGPVRQKNRLFDTLSALAVEVTLSSKDRQAWDCPDNNRNGPYRQKNGLSVSLSTYTYLGCSRNVGCCSHVP